MLPLTKPIIVCCMEGRGLKRLTMSNNILYFERQVGKARDFRSTKILLFTEGIGTLDYSYNPVHCDMT